MKKQKTIKTATLLILALLLGVLATSALAQNGDGGETAVSDPNPISDNIEIVKVERLPSGVTQTTAYIRADRVSFISSGNPDINYGSWGDTYFGNQPGGYGAMRPVFHFPVDQLPNGANITTSYFKINLKSVEDSQTRQYNAYTLSSSWAENSITWNNRPGRSSTVAWNANMSDALGWHSTNALNLTQNWYNNPSSNHGVELEGEEGANVHTRVYHSNYGPSYPTDLRPYLEVTYTFNITPPSAWITTISPYVYVGGTNWTTAQFNIQWDSADYSGTGIKWYDMYHTNNSGANWVIGQAQVTHTSTTFGPLTHNSTYGFYVRAQDNTGLEGAAPSGSGSIQQSVRIDGVAPVVTMDALPEHSDGEGVLSWSGTDDGSGIQNYDVQGRTAGGTWIDLESGTTQLSRPVNGGTHGTTYEFRVRGRDMVGNVPDWSTVPIVHTTVWLEPTAYIVGFNPSPIYTAPAPAAGDNFKVLWAGDAGSSTSIAAFSLQYFKPGNTTPIAWQTEINSSITSADFVMTADTNEFPDGIYTFQVKARDSAGTWGEYHTETQGTIIVDREDPRMTDNVVYLPVLFK